MRIDSQSIFWKVDSQKKILRESIRANRPTKKRIDWLIFVWRTQEEEQKKGFRNDNVAEHAGSLFVWDKTLAWMEKEPDKQMVQTPEPNLGTSQAHS